MHFLKKASLIAIFYSLFHLPAVNAQTIIPAADGTGTVITQEGKHITIDGGSLSQDGQNLFHSFQEFGLSAEQIATFLANPKLQNILSRVTGGNPSLIRGLIEISGGNPNLYLMNPAGIIFSENARLNVPADFTATTATGIGFGEGWFNALGENPYDDLVGTPDAFIFNTDHPSAIINAGDLKVSKGNGLNLLAGSIANTGSLTAQAGNIIVTAVPEKNILRITQPGSILSLEITPPETSAGEWHLSVYDLPALLTGMNVPETGLTVAETSETVHLDQKPLPTDTGSNLISGKLDVSGENGGNIYVLGKKVGLYDAYLTAEGTHGGGQLLIGGDEEGQLTLPRAQRTFISPESQLSVNAVTSGDAGQVLVGSDEATVFAGQIIAQGGQQSGHGGFVKLSGQADLAFQGSVDLSTSQGEIGTLVLDFQDLIIDASAEFEANQFLLSSGGALTAEDGIKTDLTISDQALTNLEGNIILEANRDLIITPQAHLTFTNQTAGESLIFTAERNLEAKNNNIITQGADLTFTANTGAMLLPNLKTSGIAGDNAGNIKLTAQGDITTGNLDTSSNGANAGEITLISNQGGITVDSLTAVPSPEGSSGQGGGINLKAGGNVTLENSATTSGKDFNLFSEGDVTIQGTVTTAGGNIFITGITIDAQAGNLDSSHHKNSDTVENLIVTITGESQALAQLLLAEKVTLVDHELSSSDHAVEKFVGELATDLGFESGIVIPTDHAKDAEATNLASKTATNSVISEQEQLNHLVPESETFDAATVEITSNSEGKNLLINYLLLSDEDKSFVGSELNNVFEFFPNNKKIAEVPETGEAVSADMINASTSDVLQDHESASFNLESGSLAQVLIAIAKEREPGPSPIRLFLSETGKANLDAAVFLRARSFSNATRLERKRGGDVTLKATGDITTGDITTGGGAITMSSETGTVDTSIGSLDTSANALQGGAINIKAPQGNLVLQELKTFSSDFSGGNINLLAGDSLQTTGVINSSSNFANGGDISLKADGDIEVNTLNAEGGRSGGTIDIRTDHFFRATGTFLAQNETLVSLSSIGSKIGGRIRISHGGEGKTPFVVGDAAINGTAGKITNGQFEIFEGAFLFTEKKGNIALISVEEPELLVELQEELEPEQLNEEPSQPKVINNAQLPVQILTFDQARLTLNEIRTVTGAKPALIYVNFTPPSLTGVTDFQRQEALSTQAYEQYFSRSQRKSDLTLSVPRQASDQLQLLLVTEGGEPYPIVVENATRAEVAATATELYELISVPPNPLANHPPSYLQPAQKLYRWLIEPLSETLSEQGIENLVFVMPPGLRLLPIAALHDGEQFLVEQYSVGLSPSLSLTDTRYKDLQDLEVLAVGASHFADPTAVGPLPAVEVELPTIAKKIWRGQFAINEGFTLKNFRQQRRRNPEGIVHIATHADFRSGNPEEIYIQFYDQKVRLDEIRQLNLNDPPVELLVLSACRTAVGNEDVELGFAGLTVQTGVKSALASLWYVGDTGTVGLMSEFYRQLNTASIKAEAMRRAQVALLRGQVRLEGKALITPRGELSLPPEVSVRAEDLSHPYYWAAFTMVGSPW